jgi:ABC-type multidrug transport system ATPase subunit
VLVTHDVEVSASCDRIIRMRDGLIVADERVAKAESTVGTDRPSADATPIEVAA